LLLPGPILLIKAARHLRREKGDRRYRARIEKDRRSLRDLIYMSFTRPIILLFTEPVVAGFGLWVGFGWGILYGLLESISLVFQTLYGFDSAQVGLVSLSIPVGAILGWLSNIYQEKLYRRNVERIGPEARLYCACAAGLIFPAGWFIYAWTSSSNIHWIAPTIGIAVVVWGVFLIYLAVFNYLADAYLMYASSALAGQSLIRNLMGAIFPLFTTKMYTTLGFQWASALLGFIALGLAVIPFALFFWGPHLRARSRFADMLSKTARPTSDPKIAGCFLEPARPTCCV